MSAGCGKHPAILEDTRSLPRGSCEDRSPVCDSAFFVGCTEAHRNKLFENNLSQIANPRLPMSL